MKNISLFKVQTSILILVFGEGSSADSIREYLKKEVFLWSLHSDVFAYANF